jgi:hypothetical protein
MKCLPAHYYPPSALESQRSKAKQTCRLLRDGFRLAKPGSLPAQRTSQPPAQAGNREDRQQDRGDPAPREEHPGGVASQDADAHPGKNQGGEHQVRLEDIQLIFGNLLAARVALRRRLEGHPPVTQYPDERQEVNRYNRNSEQSASPEKAAL